MKLAYVLILLTTIAILGVFASKPNSCYAPPLFYGARCDASEALFGSKGVYIRYSVDITGDVNIECKATGKGYREKDNKAWGWYYLGLLKDGDSATLYWGDVAAKPEIRCKGDITGSTLIWTYEATSSNI